MRRLVCGSLVLAFLGCSADTEIGMQGSALSGGRRSYLLLGNSAGSLPAGLARKLADVGGKVTASLPDIGVAVVESNDPSFAAKARKLPGVRSVVTNRRRQYLRSADRAHVATVPQMAGPHAPVPVPPATPVPSDPAFPLQFGLQAVDAPAAWARGVFGQGVRVAVLDTGIVWFHPDVESNLDMDDSISFVPGESVFVDALQDFTYHGLHVAATIAGAINGGFGVGVAPQAQLIAVKVLGNDGFGVDGAIIQGLMHAASVGAHMVNMSIVGYLPRGGGCYTDGDCETAQEVAEQRVAYNRAIQYARKRGTTVIAAAGNEGLDLDRPIHDPIPETGITSGKDIMEVPGGFEGVITVAATGPYGWGVNRRTADVYRPAGYSNHGQSFVDLAAPGGDFAYPHEPFCTARANGFSFPVPCWVLDMVIGAWGNLEGIAWSAGTSMAAPHVAGVAALILSEETKKKMNPAQVEAALRKRALDLGKRGNDDHYGLGFARFAPCVPETCEPGLCGTITGCGTTIKCGGCGAGDICNPETSTCCTRRTCADAPAGTCGKIPDFCGGTVDCGGCGQGQTCFEGFCCTPRTCEAGVRCGVQSDGCGGTIDCPGCSDGQACSPFSGMCCTSNTCEGYGVTCGEAYDQCTGNIFDCGTCPEGQVCNGHCCTPTSCEARGKNCGWGPDDCGVWAYCGECPQGQTCRSDNTCCTPQTCESLGAQCGFANDGCGGFLFCSDACPGGQVCNYDENRCCTPTVTCESAGAQCGFIIDDCGQFTYCGECPEDDLCDVDNQCVPPPTYDPVCSCVDGATVTRCATTDCFGSCWEACAERGLLLDFVCMPPELGCTPTNPP